MTKEQLIAMGLTEEQAGLVMKSLDGNFVTKTRFDEVNLAKKQLELDIKERDGQLETLKKATGNTEELQTKIAELQALNLAKDTEYSAKIKQIQLDAAVERALTSNKAKNIKAVKALLDLENAELDGENIKGLDEQLKKLKAAAETSFLFEAEQTKPQFKGFVPGEAGDVDFHPTGDFGKLTSAEKMDLKEQYPEQYELSRKNYYKTKGIDI